MESKKRMSWILISILLVSILLMGVEGCPQGTGPSTTTQQYRSTSASNYGVDFSLIPGVGMLSENSKMNLGDIFNIGIHLENNGKRPITGGVCVKDDIDDSYGGMETQCTQIPFYLREAQFDEKGKVLKVGSTDVLLPSSGYYSYKDIPINQNAKVSVIVEYIQTSKTQTTVSVPSPIIENLNLNQDPEAISLKVQKSISSKEGNYEVILGINLDNKLQNSEIWTPDFKKKGVIFNAELGNYPLICKSQGQEVQGNYIEMDNTKFITCYALVPKEPITHPLTINLEYGVKMTKEFSFAIQKEAFT